MSYHTTIEPLPRLSIGTCFGPYLSPTLSPGPGPVPVPPTGQLPDLPTPRLPDPATHQLAEDPPVGASASWRRLDASYGGDTHGQFAPRGVLLLRLCIIVIAVVVVIGGCC